MQQEEFSGVRVGFMMWSMMVSPASSSASVMAPNAGGPVAHKFLVSTVGLKDRLQDEEDIHGAS